MLSRIHRQKFFRCEDCRPGRDTQFEMWERRRSSGSTFLYSRFIVRRRGIIFGKSQAKRLDLRTAGSKSAITSPGLKESAGIFSENRSNSKTASQRRFLHPTDQDLSVGTPGATSESASQPEDPVLTLLASIFPVGYLWFPPFRQKKSERMGHGAFVSFVAPGVRFC